MPGGSVNAWPLVKPIFQAIAAKVGPKNDIPCCEWVGPGGAGHYVKMVHNGIEYGDMQLICEAYLMLKEAAGLSNDELYDVFDDWNRSELESYLIEITRDIFSVKDDQGGDGYLVDKILDVAGAKGTGKWMSQLALDLGVPSTMVTEAVFARGMSALKTARVHASKILKGPDGRQLRRESRRQEGVHRGGAARPLCLARFAATPRASCNFRRPPRRTSGRSTTAISPSCGAAAASSGRRSSNGSRKPSTRTRSSKTCCSIPTSPKRRPRPRTSWRQVVVMATQMGLPVVEFSNALSYYDGYPPRAAAGQPAAGPARLLRRPHLPAHRQAARQEVPQRVAAMLRKQPEGLAACRSSAELLAATLRPRRPGRRRHRRHRRAGRRAVPRGSPRPARRSSLPAAAQERGQERVKKIEALGGSAAFLPVEADQRASVQSLLDRDAHAIWPGRYARQLRGHELGRSLRPDHRRRLETR